MRCNNYAGDDFDPWLKGTDESAWLIKHKLPKEYKDIANPLRRAEAMKEGFRRHHLERAARINEYYLKTEIPVFATLGNHDLRFVVNQMTAVRYLLGNTADFQGLTIAGLPATGEFVTTVMDFCPEFYPHIAWYKPIAREDARSDISDAAKNLLGHRGAVDVFVTHKGYRTVFYSQASGDYDVDAGAVAVDRRFRPLLKVFGHNYLSRPLCEQHNNQWFVCLGRSAAVKVAIRDRAVVAQEAVHFT